MSASLITARQVAEELNLRISTVYAAANDGRIPCVRLWKGKRRSLIRFRREDIDRLIQERIVAAPRQDDESRS